MGNQDGAINQGVDPIETVFKAMVMAGVLRVVMG